MTLIDGTTAPVLHRLHESSHLAVPDVLGPFSAEYFVEWQVADHPSVVGPTPKRSHPEK